MPCLGCLEALHEAGVLPPPGLQALAEAWLLLPLLPVHATTSSETALYVNTVLVCLSDLARPGQDGWQGASFSSH